VFQEKGHPAKSVIEEAKGLVDALGPSSLLFLISAESSVHLNDQVGTMKKHVFCLDAQNIPQGEPIATDVMQSPMVLALRRKGLSRDSFVFVFSPYQRGRPVQGWRFFGRKREVRAVIDSNANLIIVGPRRMGKTSLMQEAARILRQRKESVYYVNVQDCRRAQDVVSQILQAISSRERERAVRHGRALDERPLSIALREMTSRRNRVTLLLDELGNVIRNLDDEGWAFLGTLRKYSQEGSLKIGISCFQEAFIRQVNEFTGPLVNFGTTLRLEPFSDADIEDLVFGPLEIWRPLSASDRRELKAIVTSTVGHHPYFIQFFCEELFTRQMEEDRNPLIDIAKTIVRRDLGSCFSDPVEQVFIRLPSALLKYLFLLRCHQADKAAMDISKAEIDDDWLLGTLKDCGYSAKFSARRTILEGLEIHGLCSAVSLNRTRQRVSVPIVYRLLQKVESPVAELISRYETDIATEAELWDLKRT
jgi:hypothetical protein